MLVVLVVGAAAGCASEGTGDVSAGGDGATTSFTIADEGPSTFALPVQDVALAGDEQHLELLLGDLPASDAAGPCAYEVHPAVVEDGAAPVRLDVTITMGHPYDASFPSCPTQPISVTATLAAPLAGRDVVDTDGIGEPLRWRLTDGTIERCELPDCDPATGTAPLAAACDNSTLYDAVRDDDVPQHADIDVLGCDGSWAVVDVDIGAGSCPADEGPNPCAGVRVDRLFWHVDAGQWTRIHWSRDAGCGSVHEAEPDFPPSLCDSLPAPGQPSG